MASLIDKSNQILTEKNTNLIPENLKAGVTCLGVTGTYEGSSSTIEGIKQFSTIEEMQADPTAKEGDLAVVYRSETQSIKDGDTITSITFPKTVIFDTTITTSYSSRLRNSTKPRIYLDMRLSSTNFNVDDMNGTIPEITYTSSDGITYTRTDTNEDTYEIGETTVSRIDEHICKFIQIGGMHFDGLYEYSSSGWVLAPTQLTAIADYVYEKEFYGQNGVETGTLQNKENLTKDGVKRRVDMWSSYNSGIVCPLDSSNMFMGCTNLTSIPLLDTSSVTIMTSMFNKCTNLTTIPLLNTSSATNMNNMFQGCTNLTTIPLLDTSSATNMNSMFQGCTNLTTIPLLDTSSVTSMEAMFNNCQNLTTIPLLNTSNVTATNGMFQGCTNLTTIPLLDTSNVTDMNSMFYQCTSLTEIPLLDTSKVTNMGPMFDGCTNLIAIPLLNTSNVTNMYYLFESCTNLTTIPLLDTSSVTGMEAMFNNCTSLSDESLNNILAMCANATSYTSTKKLKYIGLTSAQANKCKTLSNYSAFTSAGWTTGY